MNKVLIGISLVLAGLAGWLSWAGYMQRARQEALRVELAATRKAIEVLAADLQESRHRTAAFQAKVNQLTMVLTNSTAELSAVRQRLHDLEFQRNAPAAVLASAPKDAITQRLLNECAPTVTVTTNAQGREERRVVFATLFGPASQVLGRDLEFSATYGRRVAFKETASARRMAFDVDEIHPFALAHLGIDPDEQKLRQMQQDSLWRQVEAVGLQLAAEEQQKREVQRAVAEAARAEERKQLAEQQKRQDELELERQRLQNEAVRADAAMRAADAAILRALNPPPVIIGAPVRVWGRVQ
ncbi:MAG: hypothetical protein HZA90_09460 [Verrucomicrobia bacterium]|nr:hypothetical protein [Verrucomicrobiota bacterium]